MRLYLNPFQKWKVTGTERRNFRVKRIGDPIWRSWIKLSTEAKLPDKNYIYTLGMLRIVELFSDHQWQLT